MLLEFAIPASWVLTALPSTISAIPASSPSGGGTPLLYQTSSGQTAVVYAPTAALGAVDLQQLLGIPALATSSPNLNSGNMTPSQQFITIPVTLAANQVSDKR